MECIDGMSNEGTTKEQWRLNDGGRWPRLSGEMEGAIKPGEWSVLLKEGGSGLGSELRLCCD